MKSIYNSILILMTVIISTSCVKEEMIKANPDFILSYQQEGKTDALAGTSFYVIPTGTGEFFTLFDGTEGKVWGEAGAKGLDFNKADSMNVQYSNAGKYNLTLVTSSSGSYGKEFSRQFKTVEVNVVDERNAFNVFNINDTNGEFAPNNEILFSIPDVVTDLNFVAFFGMDSGESKAFVNGVEQTSGVTVNDFAQPVVYTIKSANGNERVYTVKYTLFPASDEKAVTKFVLGLGGNGESGVIDEANKIINLTVNYASNLTSVRLILASSYGSIVYLNDVAYSDRRNYNLATTIKKIKIVAQNKSEVEYAINVVLDNPVSQFTFSGLVPAPIGIIDVAAKTISVDVLNGTDITKLAASWTGTVGKVTIGTTVQSNGVTLNNFSSPVTYTFYKGSTAGDKYKVIVNIK